MNLFRKKTGLLLSFTFWSISGITQQLGWAHSAGSSLIETSNAVHTDNAGNVYIAGKFSGSNVDFDPSAAVFLLSSAGSSDAFVAKYNATGQFLWAFRFGGTNRDEVQALTIDQNSNVCITGYFRGAVIDFDPGPGVVNLSSNGDSGPDPGYGGDIFIAKYNSAGQYLWAINIGGSELYDSGIAIATDAADNIYTGGYFKHAVDFDPSASNTILNSATGPIFLAKYTSLGAFQWAFNLGLGDNDNSIFDLKTDAAGNVYATGYFQGTGIDFDPSTANALLSSNGGFELFVAKYNTNGQYQFAFSAGGSGSDVGRGIALDNGGNIYVLGDFNGPNVDFDPGPGTALLSSNGLGDVVLAKYNATGQYLWAFNFGGTPNEYGWKVAIDGSHLFVTGGFSGTADFDPSPAIENLTSAGGYDIFVGKYTLNGEYLCSFNVGSAGNDFGYSIFSNATNTFYLTGSFTGTNIDFDPAATIFNLSSAGSDDLFLAKYNWPDNVRPTGTLADDIICIGEQAQLTFTATMGTGPFTIVLNNGTSNITQTNVQSGVPFDIIPNPSATTTYTLVSVKDALRCSETNFVSGISAVVTVNTCVTTVADFEMPDTVCVNTPVHIVNTSANGTNFYWNFCSGSLSSASVTNNITSPNLSMPVFTDIVQEGNNFYVFVVNHSGSLARMSFGNSLLNAPTITNLGSFGGIIPVQAEGLEIQKDGSNWIGYLIGGQNANSRLVKLNFGVSVANTPTATNLGNVGGLSFPVDFALAKDGANWYGFTISADNNTVTRYSFGNSLNNPPVAINLGNIGGLSYPTGFFLLQDGSNHHLFITNRNGSTMSRLDFGTSVANVPTGINLGNPGGNLNLPRDITVIRDCGNVFGFIANEGNNSLTRLDFNGNILSVPTSVVVPTGGNLNFPHSISEIFRTGDAVNFFVPNVNANTVSRTTFNNCTVSSIPSYTGPTPPPFQYNQPGVYNVSLFVDDGLPTQSVICKQIVVKDCGRVISGVINDYTEVLAFDPCKNALTVTNATAFNPGDTVLMIQMQGAIIDNTNSPAFGTVTDYKNSGNYEFNFVKSKTGNAIELTNVLTRAYDIPNGKVQLIRVPYYQDAVISSTLTCLPWDGSKGGVLVFNVADSLNLGADIDVSAKGFRAGNGTNSSLLVTNCFTNDYYYPSPSTIAALKGQGIAILNNTNNRGKGAAANAGGGGLDHNSGGGGGGNGGAGGFGGYQLEPCGNAPFDNRGIGGRDLPYNNASNKIFMGGGGGAGHSNNPANINFPSNGGNGGGMIIISAQTLVNNSFRIAANGENAPGCPFAATGDCHDGMGGGGAGGTVLLDIPVISSNTPVEIKGGKGADMSGPVSTAGRIGAGGGGGGGVFWTNNAVLPANISLNATGGAGGVLTTDNNNPWGTTPGANGIQLFNLQLPVDNIAFRPNIDSVRIKDSITGCSSFDFKGMGYTNTSPVTGWQWYFGDGGTASTQNTSHTYSADGTYTVKLVITDINGCKDSITKVVNAITPDLDFNYQQDVCNPLTVQFHGIGNDTQNPYWSFGDATTATGDLNPLHTYPSETSYIVRYSAGNGACTDTITKTITLAVVPDNIIRTGDTTICFGAAKQLLTQPALSFCWNPVTYLDNPDSPNPVTSTPQNITYYYTAEVTGSNLIVNGDFSQGNSDFTSAYNFANPNVTEGQYFVGTNPQIWNGSLSACGDHTTGNGNMMMVNGSPAPDVNVWEQTVTVTPNTNYAFSTWIQALWPPNPAQLQFSINGKDAGTLITAVIPTCTWIQFYTTWNSGNSTSAVISIVNKNTAVQGNDFALDDISFAPVFIKRDSVIISVDTPFVRTNADTAVCEGIAVQLNTVGGASYVWTPSAGLNNTGIADPIASPTASTQYIVTGTNVNGCMAKDTVNINIYPKPNITKSADETICKNSSIQLSASGGSTYAWTPAATLNDPSVANPIASPSVNTTYYITVTDVNTCTNTDSVKISIRPDPVFSISPPVAICEKESIQLIAGGGNIYVWQPDPSLNDPSVANPVVSPLVTTNYLVTITETNCNSSATLNTTVTVNPLPVVKASKANDLDCANDRSQLSATGAQSYTWSPASSLSDPNIFNPVATPSASTQYIVKGTDGLGCSNYDSVVVDFISVNAGGYLMPNAFTPNNDGLNDCFGIRYWGIIRELEFSIYNRWGERIFFTRDPRACWDGTYKGVAQDIGVYVYMVKASTLCGDTFRKGLFTLIR